METIQTEDKKIKKVGMKDIQREGFEYELTIAFNIDREGHYASASKDRTGLFISSKGDRDPFLIAEKTGIEILSWNESGVDAEAERKKLFETASEKLLKAETLDELRDAYEESKKHDFGEERRSLIVELKNTRKAELEEKIPKNKRKLEPQEAPIE